MLYELYCNRQDSLNAFMALGKAAWKETRQQLTLLLSADVRTLRDDSRLRKRALVPQVGKSPWSPEPYRACADMQRHAMTLSPS